MIFSSMERDIRRIRLSRLHGRLGEVVYELTKVQFSQFFQPEVWSPAINAYRCSECITVCVDLAGVERDLVDLQVEPRRLLIRGRRQAPEPDKNELQMLQILALEIDHGPFEREVSFPAEVDPERASAEQHNGLLWVRLPLRPHG
jgi:HSP20 family protein